jgi:hypothetical protein
MSDHKSERDQMLDEWQRDLERELEEDEEDEEDEEASGDE